MTLMVFCYSHIFSHHLGGFLPQQIGTDTETNSQTLHRERETLEHTAQNEMSPSKPTPESSGNPM